MEDVEQKLKSGWGVNDLDAIEDHFQEVRYPHSQGLREHLEKLHGISACSWPAQGNPVPRVRSVLQNFL